MTLFAIKITDDSSVRYFKNIKYAAEVFGVTKPALLAAVAEGIARRDGMTAEAVLFKDIPEGTAVISQRSAAKKPRVKTVRVSVRLNEGAYALFKEKADTVSASVSDYISLILSTGAVAITKVDAGVDIHSAVDAARTEVV